ncbi:MAG: GNAT family N-acetyltransferase [Cyanophyceae cyanobacterium]
MNQSLPSGYQFKRGTGVDRALLVRFMHLTYRELFPPQQDFAHLALTVEKYLSSNTPLWWVQSSAQTVACLWMGNAVDQVSGARYTHIFLLYVLPEHRQQGIAKALLQQAQQWAKARGDRQIGLQVFPHNQPALNLYQRLGFQTHSLLMLKRF